MPKILFEECSHLGFEILKWVYLNREHPFSKYNRLSAGKRREKVVTWAALGSQGSFIYFAYMLVQWLLQFVFMYLVLFMLDNTADEDLFHYIHMLHMIISFTYISLADGKYLKRSLYFL